MNKNIILMIASLAMFMEAVDTTVINTAIPAMAHSLAVNPIDLKLALISYLLSLAIFIPISGWVADKFGVKKVFIAAIIMFTICSIWCGFTQNLTELIIARFLQGMGGSLTMPVGRLIIIRTCERHELIAKMSIVVMVASLGMMLGPVLGGIITDHFSWRWIFWINAPIGLFAAIASFYLLPEMPARPVPQLDKLGFVLFGLGLAFLTYGLSTLSETDIKSREWLLILASAFLLLALYAKHSYRKAHPIVKIALLRERTFRVSVIGNLLSRFGFGGVPFLIPVMLQICLKLSPQMSGLLFAPTALGIFLVKPISLHLLRWLGYKKLLITNTFFVALSLCSFTLITETSSIYLIGFLTFAYGFLISLQYTGMNSLAYASIGEDNVSAATSIMSTIQQLAQSFGVAVAALLIRSFAKEFSDYSDLSLQIFHSTFYAMGFLTLFSMVIFFQLKKNDSKELTHKTA